MKKHVRTLFILKRRQDYSTDLVNFTNFTVSTGMYNSAAFVSDMLNDNGVESKVVVVIDNNDIDREVTAFKPTHVFIEGFWVVPEKFDVLMPLHPSVKWIIRCHSEMPFLAQEGMALTWMFDYFKRGITVSGNSPRINRELRVMAAAGGVPRQELDKKIPMLSNYYPVSTSSSHHSRVIDDGIFNVGCFGSHRPLKNHLVQAVAAIDYADQRGLKLNFHVNSGRVEMNGNSGLRNLRALFANIKHELIEHPWASHEDFLKIVSSMDVCMQVSFTETFNIVSADAVNLGVPVVVSREVNWVEEPFADPTSTWDIVEKMSQVLSNRHYLVEKNRSNLRSYSKLSTKHWLDYLNDEHTNHGLRLVLMSFKNFFS